MLSYRHSYHAGNFADVLKHICLVEILHYLSQKDKPLCYIDTHAGCGAYRLHSAQAEKTKEYQNGIARLYSLPRLPKLIKQYCQQVQQFNSHKALRAYPGSPWLAQSILRPDDRIFLCELHNQEVQQLAANFAHDKRVKVRHEDGLSFLPSFLPCAEKRALVLIDPSYEIKSDYQQVFNSIVSAHKRFATGCYALWYPVVERQRIEQLEYQFKKSAIDNILLVEIRLLADEQPGMSASGMIIINPPWQLFEQLKESLPALSQALSAIDYRLEYLSPAK